jgi:hypothetical protein
MTTARLWRPLASDPTAHKVVIVVGGIVGSHDSPWKYIADDLQGPNRALFDLAVMRFQGFTDGRAVAHVLCGDSPIRPVPKMGI